MLDNRYGDYRLPAFDDKLGVEVWKMKFAAETDPNCNWQKPDLDDKKWSEATVSFGAQFWELGPLPANSDILAIDAKLASMQQINSSEPIEINGTKYFWKPYEFSWRWGLKGDAGHQGYHGMKGEVNKEIISLGILDNSKKHMPVYQLKPEQGGSIYYLWSTVMAPSQLQAKIHKSGILPEKIYLNRKSIGNEEGAVVLNAGSNPVLLKYNTIGRGVLLFKIFGNNSMKKPVVPLATEWYLNTNILRFNCEPASNENWGWYRFAAPPGARSMVIQSSSKPEIWVAGKVITAIEASVPARFADKSVPVWKVQFPDTEEGACSVALRIRQLPGLSGGAAIPEPILFESGKGKIQLVDLGESESLKTYSGGMIYSKSITMNAKQANSGAIFLNLGKVVSSAEVSVNGLSVGLKLTAPWKFDLTGKLKVGENEIRILIYNTLGNHYLTTPSQYIGRINSGLIGPVTIEYR
jgi:hypothetical protein